MSDRLIPVSDARLVWYAGYGSNLLRKRFDCYIEGGKPEGSIKICPGCQDKTPPREDRPITLAHELYFADRSTSWNGAVAFIKRDSTVTRTYGRMYLISYNQFNDVVRQENARGIPGATIVPAFDDLAAADQWQIHGVRFYGCLIKIGTQDGHPVLTFTATRDDFTVGLPSEAYIKMIVGGLEETYPCMLKSEIIDYLSKAEGIRGALQGDLLVRWILGR